MAPAQSSRVLPVKPRSVRPWQWVPAALCLASAIVSSRLLSVGLAEPPPEAAKSPPEGEEQRARRLKQMKRAAEQYRVSRGDERGEMLKQVREPILRWTNPETTAVDGTIFIWTDRGRPEAVIGFFTFDGRDLSHEWQSLSQGKLWVERDRDVVWKPEAGLLLRKIDGGESPAESATARLRQMKGLAERFSATHIDYGAPPESPPVELRLLTQPLYRYESEQADLLDGGLFAFVQGTDPQALLILEARRDGGKTEWHYGFARMSAGIVVGKHRDQQVWSVPRYDWKLDRTQPYLNLWKLPAPAI